MADSQAWHAEDIVHEQERVACEVERDWVHQEFWDRLLAFEERHLTLLERLMEW